MLINFREPGLEADRWKAMQNYQAGPVPSQHEIDVEEFLT